MKTLKFKNLKTSRLLLPVFAVLCLVFQAAAQTDSARLQGTVTDAAGAVVAGATVKVTDLGTTRTVDAQTSDEGNFSFPSLKAGRYRVEVSQSNFKTTKQEVTLEVAKVADLTVVLETGQISDVVTVTNDVPLVESGSSALGATITGREAVELPLNGRNVLELARLSPGVTQGVVGGFASGQGGNAETYRGSNVGGAAISVNGQRTQANNFLLDGVDNNESLVNTINIFPSAEGVQEFRVQTSVATAEFGRGGGAIINSTIKSGRKRFYGSAFAFVRNDNLDARKTFSSRKSEFRRGQFGGTVGGPIYIARLEEDAPPYFSKDKAFFFVSYDALRQFLPGNEETATVPTGLMRSGNFSELPTQLRDPLDGRNICVTGTTTNGVLCANGNGIAFNRLDLLPGNRLNQAALNYLRAFPGATRTGLQNNYQRVRNQINDQDNYDARVDVNITNANQMFARFSNGTSNQVNESRLETLPAGFGSGSNPIRTRGFVVGLNSSLKSNLFNEFRVQINRIRFGYEPPFGDQPLSANLGIVNANRSSILGGGALIGGYNGQLEYTGDYGPYRVPQTTFQVLDGVSYVKGDHTIKVGGTIIRRNVSLFRPTAGKGYFFLYGNGDPTQCGGPAGGAGTGTTGWESADLLIGFVCRYDIGNQDGPVGTRTWENGAFAQDDWKATSKLTINYGVRYEYLTNPSEQYARQSNFDLNTGRLVLAADNKDTLTTTDKNNFGPRVGFAYDIFGKGKTVLRGGYGLFYFLDRGGIDNQLAQNPPYSGQRSFSYQDGYRITLSGQGPLNSLDSRLATNPLPSPTVVFNQAFLNSPSNVTVLALRPDNKTSNVQQFNIQVQHEIMKNTALSVAYVGTRGRNLALYYNLQGRTIDTTSSIPCPISGRTLGNCYPSIGNSGRVNVRDDNGKSSYDSLQVQLERRFSGGWQYIASYTFSKTKDNGNGSFDAQGDTNINFIEPFTTSQIDFPHVFSFATVYDIPFGRNRKFGSDIPRALDYIIGGWQLNGIFRAQSGSPFDIRNGGIRVDVNGDPYGSGTTEDYLRRAAFTIAPTGRFGTLERNSLRTPSTRQLNLGVSKNFNFTERTKIQFRAEAFNLTNSPQLTGPNTNLGDADPVFGFGRIRGTQGDSERQIQLGLRLEF